MGEKKKGKEIFFKKKLLESWDFKVGRRHCLLETRLVLPQETSILQSSRRWRQCSLNPSQLRPSQSPLVWVAWF